MSSAIGALLPAWLDGALSSQGLLRVRLDVAWDGAREAGEALVDHASVVREQSVDLLIAVVGRQTVVLACEPPPEAGALLLADCLVRLEAGLDGGLASVQEAGGLLPSSLAVPAAHPEPPTLADQVRDVVLWRLEHGRFGVLPDVPPPARGDDVEFGRLVGRAHRAWTGCDFDQVQQAVVMLLGDQRAHAAAASVASVAGPRCRPVWLTHEGRPAA